MSIFITNAVVAMDCSIGIPHTQVLWNFGATMLFILLIIFLWMQYVCFFSLLFYFMLEYSLFFMFLFVFVYSSSCMHTCFYSLLTRVINLLYPPQVEISHVESRMATKPICILISIGTYNQVFFQVKLVLKCERHMFVAHG